MWLIGPWWGAVGGLLLGAVEAWLSRLTEGNGKLDWRAWGLRAGMSALTFAATGNFWLTMSSALAVVWLASRLRRPPEPEGGAPGAVRL